MAPARGAVTAASEEVLVPAREVLVGDFVVLPQIGARCVTDVKEGTVGLEQLPCLWITYGLGMSLAWGRSGPVSSPLPEATLRPFQPDELVPVRPRPLTAVRELL